MAASWRCATVTHRGSARCLGTSDLSAVLANPDVQAVYVATPNDQHRPVVAACAAAGKHVLCEKPMATNSVDAAAMVDACARAGVTLGIAYDQRFHAAHRHLRALMADGTLGTIMPRPGSSMPAGCRRTGRRTTGGPIRAGRGAVRCGIWLPTASTCWKCCSTRTGPTCTP